MHPLCQGRIPKLGVTEGATIARRNLKEILLYSVTQLAMWLSKPDMGDNALCAPMDAEDMEGQTSMQGPGSGLATLWRWTSSDMMALVRRIRRDLSLVLLCLQQARDP